eukprot:6204130-Pleurochrysis_carterae.AAC.4
MYGDNEFIECADIMLARCCKIAGKFPVNSQCAALRNGKIMQIHIYRSAQRPALIPCSQYMTFCKSRSFSLPRGVDVEEERERDLSFRCQSEAPGKSL